MVVGLWRYGRRVSAICSHRAGANMMKKIYKSFYTALMLAFTLHAVALLYLMFEFGERGQDTQRAGIPFLIQMDSADNIQTLNPEESSAPNESELAKNTPTKNQPNEFGMKPLEKSKQGKNNALNPSANNASDSEKTLNSSATSEKNQQAAPTGQAVSGVDAQTIRYAKQGLTLPTHIGGHLNNKTAYPPLSLQAGESGVVSLRAYVQPDGRAAEVKLIKSSGYQRLDAAAIGSVKSSYRFTPAIQDGQAIAYWYEFKIYFKRAGGS